VDGAKEVLRVAVVTGFLSSFPEPVDGVGLCRTVDVVGAVALAVGFRTVDVAGGRVGGALRPPVRVVELRIEVLGALEAVAVTGRLAAVAVEGFLTNAASSFLTTFLVSDLAGDPFAVCVSVRLASSLVVDASSSAVGRGGVAGFSTSAMMRGRQF